MLPFGHVENLPEFPTVQVDRLRRTIAAVYDSRDPPGLTQRACSPLTGFCSKFDVKICALHESLLFPLVL